MAGDLLKLDIVADRQGYYTDAAVTLLIEPEQCSTTDFRLRECAFWAFHEALKAVKPGVPTNDIGRVVEGVAKDYKFSVMEGFGGHGVGKTIHESPFVPNHYMEECNKDILLEGMVITIEPIICELSGTPKTLDDGWTVTTVDGGRTAHYEHTLCLTKDGPVLVTQ
jgi:methionyl aminopeptidase